MHWLNRILLAAVLAAAIAYGPAPFESAATHEDLARIRKERESLVAANMELRAQLRALRAEVEALQHDPAEVARIAREDLNLVAPGEVVFNVQHEAR
jgi:cell division protein FtsB